MSMKHGFPVIDGDGHVYEDDDALIRCYEGPHAIRKRNKSMSIFPSLDGFQRGVIHEYNDKNPNRPYFTNADIWHSAMDKFGFSGAVLFPTAGLGHGLMRDQVFSTATAVAYNNWMEQNYTSQSNKLFGAGLTPIMDPPAAAQEIRRCATQRKNFACMVLPTVTSSPLKYGDKFYWPIFEEAERQNIPLALHGGPSTGFGLDQLYPFYMVHTLSHPVPLFMHLSSMIFNGVFDAFPKVRVAFMEAGCSWVTFMLDRLDGEYEKIYSSNMRANLKRRPSEYLRDTDNFWCAAELEEKSLKYVIDAIGPDRLLYTSDFPHEPTEDAIAAAVPAFIKDAPYSDEIKRKILYKNSARLYHITERGIERPAARPGAAAAE
jgi:predicted TIM-barrel fold metal-dependent hydrolase